MATDYLYTEDKDLMIKNGDFVVGQSDAQHVENLLLLQKGEVKEFPLVGIGLRNYGLAPWHYTTRQKLKKNAGIQLKYDGVKKPVVNVEPDKISIDATY